MAKIYKGKGKSVGYWGVDYFGVDGKRHRKIVGASYALAKDALAKHLAEAAENRHFPARVANSKPFETVADKFLELHVKNLESRNWAYMLKKVREAFKGKKMGDVTASDVQRFYNAIMARSSASTANRFLTLLCSLFNKARAWGDFYGDNPTALVKRQREAQHRLRFLSHEEIASLYRVAHERLYPVVASAILTGMRKGELLGLDWQNVSLERSTIYLLKTKSGKARELPITPRLQEVLASLEPKASGAVFDLPDITLRRYFARALKDAKISGFRFHDLRHTAASHWVMNGIDLYTVQRLLGHSSPVMTQRYAHLSRTHLAASLAASEASMPSKAAPSALAWQNVVNASFGDQVAKA